MCMPHDVSEIEELWPNGRVPAWVTQELTRSENGAFLISEMLLENVGPVVIVTTLIGPGSETRAFYEGLGIYPSQGMKIQVYETREAASDGHAVWGVSREKVAHAIHRRKALTERVIAALDSEDRATGPARYGFCHSVNAWADVIPEAEMTRKIGNYLRNTRMPRLRLQ